METSKIHCKIGGLNCIEECTKKARQSSAQIMIQTRLEGALKGDMEHQKQRAN